jgi:hypothetical protein
MFDKIRVFSLATTLGVALLAAVPQMRASEFDKKTVLTFNTPVEVSGRVLAAGTYVFKTLDDDRNIVMVMNSDEDHMYALLNTIPVETMKTPDKARVEFSERGVNAPPAIREWFYPGENVGWEIPSAKVEKEATSAHRAD